MNENKLYTAAEVEKIKEDAYREAWEDAYAYLFSLMGHKGPIDIPDNEVREKLSHMDAFLHSLKF